MSMKRYVKQSRGWWIAALVLFLLLAACAIPVVHIHRARQDVTPQGLYDADVYLGDYYTVDVQYMTSWVYRVDYSDGTSDVFYLMADPDNLGSVISMSDEQYEDFKAIVEYTASEDCDLLLPQEPAEGETELLAAMIPLAVEKPRPIAFAGVACSLPEKILSSLAQYMEMSEDEFVSYYGDYYLDGKRLPSDAMADILYIFPAYGVYLLIIGGCAISYDAVYRKMRKRLQAQHLWERAVSEFSYLKADPRGKVAISNAFLYVRRRNIVLPLADVAWVYQIQQKLPGAKRIVVVLMTHDAKNYQVVLGKRASHRYADAIISAISHRNPDVLVGLTRENRDIYHQEVPKARMAVARPWLAFVAALVGYFVIRLILNLLS